MHHNDADGLCAAASLTLVLESIQFPQVLLPLEKIHEITVAKIHRGYPGCLIYADLGGQAAELISRQALACSSPLVIILDHHLPGQAMGNTVLHLNPELHRLDGDLEVSGAAVCALFAGALLDVAGKSVSKGKLALYGVIGAYRDGQATAGDLIGVNSCLSRLSMEAGLLPPEPGRQRLPSLGSRTVPEVVEILNRLGSIGFYSGHAGLGVHFLLGRNTAEALRAAEELRDLQQRLFQAEVERMRRSSSGPSNGCASLGAHPSGSPKLFWVDVQDRFQPMGVKAIVLFLEKLSREEIVDTEAYLIGFQRLPDLQPGLGPLGRPLTKVSARVPAALRKAVEAGQAPDLMCLVPPAAGAVDGIADGCHRYSAAALIDRGRELGFVAAFRKTLEAFRPS